jgi:hypothetical protein
MHSMRQLAIARLFPLASAVDRVVLARRFGIQEWLLDAFNEVVLRPSPLVLSEGRRLAVEDIILITQAREQIRHGFAHTASIEARGELLAIFGDEFLALNAAQVDNDVSPTHPEIHAPEDPSSTPPQHLEPIDEQPEDIGLSGSESVYPRPLSPQSEPTPSSSSTAATSPTQHPTVLADIEDTPEPDKDTGAIAEEGVEFVVVEDDDDRRSWSSEDKAEDSDVIPVPITYLSATAAASVPDIVVEVVPPATSYDHVDVWSPAVEETPALSPIAASSVYEEPTPVRAPFSPYTLTSGQDISAAADWAAVPDSFSAADTERLAQIDSAIVKLRTTDSIPLRKSIGPIIIGAHNQRGVALRALSAIIEAGISDTTVHQYGDSKGPGERYANLCQSVMDSIGLKIFGPGAPTGSKRMRAHLSFGCRRLANGWHVLNAPTSSEPVDMTYAHKMVQFFRYLLSRTLIYDEVFRDFWEAARAGIRYFEAEDVADMCAFLAEVGYLMTLPSVAESVSAFYDEVQVFMNDGVNDNIRAGFEVSFFSLSGSFFALPSAHLPFQNLVALRANGWKE